MQSRLPGHGRAGALERSYLVSDRVVQALVLDALRPDAYDHALLAPARDARGPRTAVAHGQHVDVLVRAFVDERRASLDAEPEMEVLAVDGHDRDARIGQQVSLLGASASRVEDHVVALAVDPHDRRVR